MAKLLVLFVVAVVDTIGLALIVPILPYYAQRLGASATLVGLLISSFSISQLVIAPWWGRMSDRYGRRPAILAGLLVSAAAYVVFAFADSVWLLLLSRVVQGLGGGTIGVVQAYVADASAPEQRTRALGWFTAVTSFGWIAGSALGSLLASIGGQRAPGVVTAALALLVAVFAWKYLAESKGMRQSGAYAAPQKVRTGFEAVRHVIDRWHDPAPRLIWIYAMAIGAFYGTAAVMPLLLQDRLGTTEKTIGYIVMYFAGMGILVRAGILGRLVDWLGETRLARLGVLLLASGLALASVGRGYPLLFTSFTMMPLGTAFLFPCITGLLSRIVSSGERGLFLSVQQTFGGVSRVAFPIGAGILMDRFELGTPYWVAGIMVMLTLPLLRDVEATPGA